MQHLQELQRLLKPYFSFSHARLECLSHFIIGLLAVNDVNLTKIAKSFCTTTLTASSYKRVQRFLKGFSWTSIALWKLIEHCFDLKDNLHIALDRTNWKFGKYNINILTLAVCYKGIGIPFIWLLLAKKGNSDCEERLKILDTLLSIIAPKRIAAILGDREFVGKEWLQGMVARNIPFVMRTRENISMSNTRGLMLPISVMARGIKIGKCVTFPRKRKIMDCELYVSALRLPSGELLILLTNQQPELAFDRYRLRWNIETLFSALKKRGLNFENTHLAHHDRLSNLLLVMTIALIMGVRQGEFLEAENPTKLKKHGYAAIAIFKRGLEHLGKLIFMLCANPEALCEAIIKVFRPQEQWCQTALASGSVL